jgi:DNA-binding CsgD family transcriptional regulator
MSKLDEYSRLVSSIYDAGLDFEQWPIAIERLSDALGGNGGGLAKHNLVTGGGAVVMARRDPIFTRLYAEHYNNNVLFNRAGRVSVETCVTDRDVMPREEFFRTEFYNGFLRPQDDHTLLAAYVLADTDCAATLTIGRSPRRGEWEREHIDLMRRVAPHLHRAAQLNLRLGGARFDAESSAEVLHNLACGVVIVTGDGKALFVNRAAEAILAAADGISLDAAGLRAAERQQSAALRKLIAAAATGGAEHTAAGGMLSLSRPSARRPLAVLVAPLHVTATWFVDRQPRAIVFVVDPERGPIVPEKYLRRLYNLTPAEAAVAVRMLRGEGLQAVADGLRVTLPTVCTHRQRVFEKTGTKRQAELVRVILEGAAGIGLEGLSFRPTEPVLPQQ